MKNYFFAITLVSVLLLQFSVSGAIQQKSSAIPVSDTSYTNNDLAKDIHNYYLKFFERAYLKHGQKNEKWDKKIDEFFKIIAIDYGPDQNLTNTQKAKILGDEILLFGCQDPMFLYHYAVVLGKMGIDEKAIEYHLKAYDKYQKSTYQKIRWAYAARAMLQYKTNKIIKAKYNEIVNNAVKWFCESLKDDSFEAGDEKIFFHFFYGAWWKKLKKNRELYEGIQLHGEKFPYIVETVSGCFAIEEAWRFRGGGWASEVTEEGWTGLKKHMILAKEHLTKAWKLNENLPYAPTQMITVIMAGHGEKYETERLWFERSVKAWFDYMPAYDKYIWSIYPRWGGSHKQMYEFALECHNTARYDTKIPLKFMDILLDIRNDYNRNEDFYWLKPGNFDKLEYSLKKYEEANPKEKYWYKSLLAAVAWSHGKYDITKKLFDELNDNLNEKAFTEKFEVTKKFAEKFLRGKTIYTPPTQEEKKQTQAYYKAGRNEKTYEKSIEYFSKAIELNPGYASAYLFRAHAYSQLHRQRHSYVALEDINTYIKFVDNYAWAYQFRASMNPEYKSSLVDISKAIKLDPFDSDNYNIKGFIYKKMYDDNKSNRNVDDASLRLLALACYNKATELDPTNPYPYKNRMEIYIASSNYERASMEAEMAAKYGADQYLKNLIRNGQYKIKFGIKKTRRRK